MRYASPQRAFTLIELLTVIAIIAVLAALIFPLAGTVREQARASDCMTKMHQLWVSANVYKQDEGAFPPALMGFAETQVADANSPTGYRNIFMTDAAQVPVPADRTQISFLYGEQVKDSGVFRCPDNTSQDKLLITTAYFPPKPTNWPAAYSYVGDALAGLCGTTTAGGQTLTLDCWTEGPEAGKPKYFYRWNSYDIGPYIDPATGTAVAGLFVRHYSRDWTGVEGLMDLPNQLKYANPPDDRTLLTYCTWHAAITGGATAPAISMGGTAKKVELKRLYQHGANVYNQ